MSGAAGVARVGVPFVWLGAVLAISFLETPVKFRAPSITVALGLGIGRLVFRALDRVELALGVLLTVAVLVGGTGPTPMVPVPVPVPVLVGVVWVLWRSSSSRYGPGWTGAPAPC
jgi:hypothetical protein